jgi:hypothetical protein
MSEAVKYLNSLERFDCPSCGQQTVFKSGCNDCLIKESNEEDQKALTKEIAQLEQELFKKRFELSSARSKLFELRSIKK